VTITFNEAVTGLTNADLTIANGSLSAVASTDLGITWTAIFTPAADTTDTSNLITLANTGVLDAAGNAGVGTTSSNNFVIDTLRPSATIVMTDEALKVGDTTLVTITFNEAVTGFTNADLTISNGSLPAVATTDLGITWTAIFTPTLDTTDATNLITLANTGVLDAAGNAGTGTTNSNNFGIDTLRPSATIVMDDDALQIGDTSLVTITFNETVTGFTNEDVTIANGTLSAVATADLGITWTATFTPTVDTTDATNLVTLANTGVLDAAGNAGNGTTSSNNFVIDTLRPSATIVVTDEELKAEETSLVTITFNEAVTGFTNDDLTLSNGSLSAVASTDFGITWTATFNPTGDTTNASNLITLANIGVLDLAGNAGVGTTNSNNFTIDTLRPSATIVMADTALAAGDTSLVTITFNEAVTGFTNDDLTIVNGSLSAVASTDLGITWTATFTPTVDTTNASNLITLANSGVLDAAGNEGVGTTNSNNFAIDTLRPSATTVVITSAAGIQDNTLNAGDVLSVTVTMSETTYVTDTPRLALHIGGTTVLASYASGTGTTGLVFTYTILTAQTDTNGISIDANSLALSTDTLTDAAGNAATLTHAAVTDNAGFLVDTTAPPITAGPTIASASTISLTVDESSTAGLYSAGSLLVGSAATMVTNVANSITVAAQPRSLTTTQLVVSDLAGNITTSSNVFLGTPGNDIVSGTGSTDIIFGFAGADTIDAGNGADQIALGGADGSRDVVKLTSTTAADLALEGGDTITDFRILSTCDMINFAAGALVNGTSHEYIGFTTINATILANQVVITLGGAAFTSTADLSVNANALAIINALDTDTVLSGDRVVVLMDNNTNTYMWLYAEANGNAAVDTAELSLLTTFIGITDAGNFSAVGPNTGQTTAIQTLGAAVATDYFSIG